MAELHSLPLQEFLQLLHSDLYKGLSNELAEEINKKQGDNKLPQPQKAHPILLFLKQVTNWFAILLWIGAILSSIIYIIDSDGNEANLYLALSLVAVILITGAITYLQTAKSQEIMSKFRQMIPSSSRVIRNGIMIDLPAQKLVRGDLLQLADGQRIPADIRIIQSQNMKVDNSSITGQTNLLLRTPQSTSSNILETANVALFGTHCKMGRGRGIVLNIGAKTYLGSVAQISQKSSGNKSPLQLELDYFVLMITIIACTLGVIFMILGKIVVNYTILDCALFGIGIIVANVPQGVLACVTISLAITAKRLSQKNVLVKNLQSVQTLGSTSCICSDKTGTLTMNKMTVSKIWIDNKIFQSKQISQIQQNSSIKYLLHCAILSSSAKFQISNQSDKIQNKRVFGDASQTALLRFVQSFESVQNIRNNLYKSAKNKQGIQIFSHFNSHNKLAFGLYIPLKNSTLEPQYHLFIKGAPQKILGFCSYIKIGQKLQKMQSYRKQFHKANNQFAQSGERVFGFAIKSLKQLNISKNQSCDIEIDKIDLNGFTFLGLASLADPPKPTVYQAIKKCRASGVKIIMITGDQSITALSIAKKIRIITLKTNLDFQKQGFTQLEAIQQANAISIEGKAIQETGFNCLQEWISKSQVIFSRTTPIHKLRIVQACQKLGYIVGVTGDGVNDAPAIKQADIGISMGISGSDVTKDAADMVLLDDDFSSIIQGIQEGRKVFDNLKKTIVYLLTSNSTEIWPFVAMVLLQIPLPLSNIFMLCICVLTDIYPAISLAYQQPEVDIMSRKARNKNDRLVTIRMMTHAYGLMGSIASAAGFYAYFLIMQVYGFPPNILFNLLRQQAVVPLGIDSQPDMNFNHVISYNPDAADLGNPFLPRSCMSATFSSHFPSWLKPTNSRYDLRLAYLRCCPSPNENQFCQSFYWPTHFLQTISPITNAPIAFTTQALFYAQSGYFAAVVMVQWLNIFACKSRKYSFIYSAFNFHMIMGIIVETAFLIFLLYMPTINQVFGGRPLNIWLLGIPGLGFSMLLLSWEEGRKFLINNDIVGQKIWFEKFIYW